MYGNCGTARGGGGTCCRGGRVRDRTDVAGNTFGVGPGAVLPLTTRVRLLLSVAMDREKNHERVRKYRTHILSWSSHGFAASPQHEPMHRTRLVIRINSSPQPPQLPRTLPRRSRRDNPFRSA